MATVKKPPSQVPPAPHPAGDHQLLDSTVEAWEMFWSTSAIAGLVQPADMPALARLFRMYDERERLERVYRAQRFVEGGATGKAIVMHPAAAEIASLDNRISKLEAEFGITPKGRLSLGITLGAAKRSLEDLNAELNANPSDDLDDEDDDDPRIRAIETAASATGAPGARARPAP